MRIFYVFVVFFFSIGVFSQKQENRPSILDKVLGKKDTIANKKPVATIDLYRTIGLERDTVFVDTSLTIAKEYSHNLLRKDAFGLLAFANDGQTYNTLAPNFALISALPEMGFLGKHFNFLQARDIRYFSVATPVTELFFKTTQTRGQLNDAFLSLNLNKNVNFSLAYKGLRSDGKYANVLANSGNFHFTFSYNTKNKRYFSNFHFASQDIYNGENGGISNPIDFESANQDFNDRQRLDVFLTDAFTFLKGKRLFLDHFYRLNPKKKNVNLLVAHQFNFENKFYEFNQVTVPSEINNLQVNRFGDSFLSSRINDQTRYNKLYNKFSAVFETTALGKISFFVEDYRSTYSYSKVLFLDDATILSTLKRQINNVGGTYSYQKAKWNGLFSVAKAISKTSVSEVSAQLGYRFKEDFQFNFQLQNTSKAPNDNYLLHQSSYFEYNWSNNFKNEKTSVLIANATTPWLNASAQLTVLNDYLYFKDTATSEQVLTQIQIIKPMQFQDAINYFSFKASREFTFGKFALDNTLLFQKVAQNDAVYNLPDLVTRNTFYYTNFFFNKALFLQAGVIFNYFTKYNAASYNPVLSEFFVQNEKEIGGYPTLDLFVNMKIQRTRIFIKAEHFNSGFTGSSYYSAPNNPYRDFTIRLGLIWNFFN